MTGTILNMTTVLVGGTCGLVAGKRVPPACRETTMAAIGLVTILIGMSMALKTHNVLIPLAALLLGGLAGEALGIDARLNRLGAWAEARMNARLGANTVAGWNVARAFVTSSLVFCVGPLTVLGSIQDGLLGDCSLLAVKSTLDGFAALVFAAALGPGVLLTLGTIAVVQGGLTLAAAAVGTALQGVSEATPWVVELSATGGVLLLGIALALLDLKHIRVANLLPAVAFAPCIAWAADIAGCYT